MINLMYIVLMAMLALNVSSDVLKGFTMIGESLKRTTGNAMKENQALYADFAEAMKGNPAKVKPWYDKAMEVKRMSDSLYNFAGELRMAIAREADGKDADPDNLQNKEDLEGSNRVMLAPARGKGKQLFDAINSFRNRILALVTDPRQKAIIASNLSTDVPRNENTVGKNWQQYMFEEMPSVAAVTMLAKLQSDVRKAENEVVHTLLANIDLKDIRVNQLNAYVSAEATTLYPGDGRTCRILARAALHKRAARHGQVHTSIAARSRHTDGVVKARIEHIHQVGRHSGTSGWCYHIILLRKVAAYHIARSVRHQYVARKTVLARAPHRKVVRAVGRNAPAVHIYLGALRVVYVLVH